MEALERVGAASCAGQHWAELSNWERLLVGFARGHRGLAETAGGGRPDGRLRDAAAHGRRASCCWSWRESWGAAC